MHLGIHASVRYLRTGLPEDRDEAIERLLRVTAAPDPGGDLDGCRLGLGQLLAERGMSGTVAERADLKMAVELLAGAVTSETVGAKLRGEAHAQWVQLTAVLTIFESWDALAADRLPDVDKLLAARRDLPADDPYSPALSLAVGLAVGFRSYGTELSADRMRAISYLADGLERIDKENPWRSYALEYFTAMLAQTASWDALQVPVERILALAAAGLAEPDLDPHEAGVYHAMIFFVRQATASQGEPLAEHRKAEFHFDKARQLLRPDHKLRAALLAMAGTFLGRRHVQSGSMEDRDASDRLISALSEHLDAASPGGLNDDPPLGMRSPISEPGVRQGFSTLLQEFLALQRGDLTVADAATKAVEQVAATLPSDNQWQPYIRFLQAAGRQQDVDPSDHGATTRFIAGLREQIQASEAISEEVPCYWLIREHAARAQAMLGLLTKDLPVVDAAIRQLRETVARAGVTPDEQARVKTLLGRLLCERFMLAGDRRDLNNGIDEIEEARRGLDEVSARLRAEVLWELAESYRLRSDLNRKDSQRAIETGLLALMERADDVLLQTSAERGLESAGDAALRSGRLVSWCLEDGLANKAVQALELGRALVLHVTTIAPDIPALLRSAGRGDLATSWQDEVSKLNSNPWDKPPTAATIGTFLTSALQSGPAIPTAIRARVLTVLRGAWPNAEWLAPPAIEDLTTTLREADCDAFVYLLAPDPGRHERHLRRLGSALVVRSDGTIVDLPLPRLTENAVQTYDEAHLAYIKTPDDESRRGWKLALGSLCDWAWDAAIAPLFDLLSTWGLGRLPRLVLIPTGKLGAVPWHAARSGGSDGKSHYAIEDAVFSYAASARQLASASRRARRPWQDLPVLLANPTRGLWWASQEAREIRRRFYPGALLLGRPADVAAGRGTVPEVMARLPGGAADQASLLHFGCHASVTGSLASSFLLLAGYERLTIGEIAAQAQSRDSRAPGFLAVLGACMSDLADVDHDEALTLASGLLAAGASGVVGARWPTGDWETAELMIMFHHFLNSGDGNGGRPADALRAAQLWMLDQGRETLAELPSLLAEKAIDPGLAEIHAWAAYTYQGT